LYDCFVAFALVNEKGNGRAVAMVKYELKKFMFLPGIEQEVIITLAVRYFLSKWSKADRH
jgi:hypothetical protein